MIQEGSIKTVADLLDTLRDMRPDSIVLFEGTDFSSIYEAVEAQEGLPSTVEKVHYKRMNLETFRLGLDSGQLKQLTAALGTDEYHTDREVIVFW